MLTAAIARAEAEARAASNEAEAARARLRTYEGNNPTLELHELSTALPRLSTAPPRLSLPRLSDGSGAGRSRSGSAAGRSRSASLRSAEDFDAAGAEGLCLDFGTERALYSFLCRCDPRPLRHAYANLARGSLQTVQQFLDGLVVYVLSKQWEDWISLYLLRLHPLPYCGSNTQSAACDPTARKTLWMHHANACNDAVTFHTTRACTAEATAGTQLGYSVGLLLVGALVRAAATARVRRAKATARGEHHLKDVPSMIGMAVGWAAGSAFLAFLGQVSGCSAHGLFAAQNLTGSGFAACTTTEDMGAVRRLVRFPAFTVTEFYALGASALIAVATVLLLVIQPLTTPPAPVADEAPRLGLGFVVASAWQLVTKALATAVMIAVTYAASQFVQQGLSNEGDPGWLATRILVLWAVALSFTCALGVTVLASLRQRLVRSQKREQAALRIQALLRWRRGVEVHSLASRRALWTVRYLADAARSRRARRGLNRRSALIQFCQLVESTAAWTTGCAWTDVVVAFVPSAGRYPSLPVLVQDALAAGGLTAAAAAWLLASASPLSLEEGPEGSERMELARAKRERYFVANAAAFFCGWLWVIVARDAAVLFTDATMAVTAPIIAGDGDHTMGEIAARGVWAAQVRDLLEAGCVALFGPGLTGLLLWLKWRWIRRLQRSTSEQLGVGLRNAARIGRWSAVAATRVGSRPPGYLI